MIIIPPPYKTMEDAIALWLFRTTRLPANRIINRNDKVPGVSLPYLTFFLPFPKTYEQDETRVGTLGSQVVYTVRGQRESILSLHSFSLATVGDLDPSGFYTARHYLEQVRTSIWLPSIRDSLYSVGLVIIDEQSSNDVTQPKGEIGQGHAQLDLRVHFNYYVKETIGTIEQVSIPVQI